MAESAHIGTDVESGLPTHATANGALLVVVLFAVAMLMVRSWEGDIQGDSVHYAALAKNILATGDWITMREGPGAIYLNKPPLLFWLTAVSFRILGVGTYAAKLPSVLFGIGTCVMVFLVGRRLFGRTAAMLAGCMAASFPGVTPDIVDCRPDSIIAFCAVVAAYAGLRAADEDRPAWFLLTGLVGGVAIMAKSAWGIHVPGATLVVLLLRRPRLLIHPLHLVGVLVSAAIALPWHVAVANLHNTAFWGKLVGEQVGERAVVGGHLIRNAAGYVVLLLINGMPWWPLGAYAIWRRRRIEPERRRGVTLAVLWVAMVVLLASVPPRSYDRYLVPAFPAVALLAGVGLAILIPERVHERLPRIVTLMTLGWMVVLAVVPVELHTYESTGFVAAKPILDLLVPGQTIAYYDPAVPTGPSSVHDQWRVRAKAFYYLDRYVTSYRSVEETLAAEERFVIAEPGEDTAPLEGAGYRLCGLLDAKYNLFRSCAGDHVPAVPAAPEAAGADD